MKHTDATTAGFHLHSPEIASRFVVAAGLILVIGGMSACGQEQDIGQDRANVQRESTTQMERENQTNMEQRPTGEREDERLSPKEVQQR